MTRRIPTKYPHAFNADGTRLKKPCPGFMEIVCEPGQSVASACNTCGDGFKFKYVLKSGDTLREVKSSGSQS